MPLRFWTSRKEHDRLAARITNLEKYQKCSAEVMNDTIGPDIIDLRKQASAHKDQFDMLEKQHGATHALLAHLQARVTRVELLLDRLRRRRGDKNNVVNDNDDDRRTKDNEEVDNNKRTDNTYVGKGKASQIDDQNTTSHEQPSQQNQYDIPSPLQLRRAAGRRSRPIGDKVVNNDFGYLSRRREEVMSWTPAERDLYGPLIQDGGAGPSRR